MCVIPLASFIGFTGTPIEKVDAKTQETFVGYVSIYDIEDAKEDKAGRTSNIEHRSEEKRRLAAEVRRMCRPFRAWNPVGDGTQGVALGCGVVPRWGVCNSQGFLVS
jgi:hypothetical protein